MSDKPILCLDFDGVINGYQSGWEGADVIPDPPVPGAFDFIKRAQGFFRVAIFSSRSHQPGGIAAMREWIIKRCGEVEWVPDLGQGCVPSWIDAIEWPTVKPPAMITIDDRAIPFTGTWPQLDDLLEFRPWNKR